MESNQGSPGRHPHDTESLGTKSGMDGSSRGVVDEWSWLDQVPLPKNQQTQEHYFESQVPTILDNVERARYAEEDENDKTAGSWRESLPQVLFLAQYLTDMYRKSTRVRNDAMLLREQAIFERKEGSYRRNFFMESLQALADRTMDRQNVGHVSGDDLDMIELQRRLRADKESVEAQDQKMLDIEAELLRKDNDLQDMETVIAQTSEDLNSALRQNYVSLAENDERWPYPQALTAEESVASPSISPFVPAPLEDYYEKMGAVGWNRERLEELQMEYEECRVDRLFKKDQEEELAVTDEDFENDYRQRLFNAKQAVANAEVEAEEARAVCVAEGLDPDGHRSHHDEEIRKIAYLPFTSPGGPQEFIVALSSPTPGLKSILGERDQSSTMLTTVTGPLNHDAAPKARRKRGTQRSRSRVRHWMQSNNSTEQYPFEEENFQQHPTSRPIAPSRRSINGSLEDLKDWPVVAPDIKERLSPQLREHYNSEPNVFSRKAVREQVRPARSFPQLRMEEQRQRKDSQQENYESIKFEAAKTSGMG